MRAANTLKVLLIRKPFSFALTEVSFALQNCSFTPEKSSFALENRSFAHEFVSFALAFFKLIIFGINNYYDFTTNHTSDKEGVVNTLKVLLIRKPFSFALTEVSFALQNCSFTPEKSSFALENRSFAHEFVSFALAFFRLIVFGINNYCDFTTNHTPDKEVKNEKRTHATD